MTKEQNLELIQAIRELAKEKNIDENRLFDAIADAMKAGYKKKYGDTDSVDVVVDKESGKIAINANFLVVEGEPKHGEISLDVARESSPDFQAGDVITREVDSDEFGRMAALAAKQIVTQRIREAEQESVNQYFAERKGTVVSAMIQRIENGIVYLDMVKADGVLARSEQIPGEQYFVHQRIRVYVLDMRRSRFGTQILVSRTHPGLLRRLFELEIPEIANGVVNIKSVVREPGSRSKISVYCNDAEIDALGACVGLKGRRVQNIVDELNGEKIDIVRYSENPAEYVANALSPSKVVEARANDDQKVCRVIVPDYQLSLAIGKDGQNARLAAKLTNWKIDIKSDRQAEKVELGAAENAKAEAAESTTEEKIYVPPTSELVPEEVVEGKSEEKPEETKEVAPENADA